MQSLISVAQIDTILWQKCLGTDEGRNWPYAVAKCGNGYLFGIDLEANGPGVTNFHGTTEAWIVRTDSIGNIIWERCYGGSNGEVPEKIINVDDTSFYLMNWSDSDDGDVQNGRGGEFWVVKTNNSGDIIWENSYGGTVIGEEPRDALLMPDKGLLLMGRITSSGGDVTDYYGAADIWLCRIDSQGMIGWQKTYGNQGQDNALKLKLTSKNTVLMIGGHYESGGMIDCPDLGIDGADVWVIEMDLKGTLLNQWCYGGSHNDLGWDIIELEDGYVFAANTKSNDGDVSGHHGEEWNINDDFWVVKIDFNGNIIWQKCLGGSSWEYPVYLTQTVDSGLIIIGNTCSLDSDVTGNHSLYDYYADIWVVKLNNNGELEWEHCFGGNSVERFWGIHSVLKKDDYNYVLGANANYLSDDVECDLFPNDLQDYAWLLEIKDCTYYMPEAPLLKSGPDTLCTIANPVSLYSIDTVQWATGYEWSIEPDNAGTINNDSLSAVVTWNTQFEGPVVITVRSSNDCGNSAWSEPHVTQVYTCLGTGEYNINGYSLIINPNPAHEKVTISIIGEIRKEPKEISFLNILGNEIKRGLLSEGEESTVIDISELAAGIYFVAIMDEGKRVTSGKMVVAR